MWRDICWKETLYWEEEPAAELELTVPLPAEHDRGADRMGRWCARLAALWYRRWTGEFYRAACGACAGAREASRPFWPWRARLEAQVTRADDRVCSLWMEGSERGGRGGGGGRRGTGCGPLPHGPGGMAFPSPWGSCFRGSGTGRAGRWTGWRRDSGPCGRRGCVSGGTRRAGPGPDSPPGGST